MRQLWADAGLEQIQTRLVAVQRTFSSFEALWEIVQLGASTAPVLRGLSAQKRLEVRSHLREILGLTPSDSGALTCTASAIAIQGSVGGGPGWPVHRNAPSHSPFAPQTQEAEQGCVPDVKR